MAVKLMGNIHNFIGLSSDTKPTTGIPVGSTFTELDTGAKFVWEGDTWEDDLTLIYAFSQALEY